MGFSDFWKDWLEHLQKDVELKYEALNLKLFEEIQTDKNIEVLFKLGD